MTESPRGASVWWQMYCSEGKFGGKYFVYFFWRETNVPCLLILDWFCDNINNDTYISFVIILIICTKLVYFKLMSNNNFNFYINT